MLERATTWKQALHIGHVLRFDITQIQARQAAAVLEHANHARRLARIEVEEPFDGRQVLHSREPIIRIVGPSMGKRGIENHLANILLDIWPYGFTIIL